MSRSRHLPFLLCPALLLPASASAREAGEPASLVLVGGKVWTDGEAAATAVAVRGEAIARVGSDAEVLALAGPLTERIELGGRLLVPGFIDAHTHFGNAAEWFFGVPLYDAASSDEVLARLREAVARVPEGMWISGGDWGAEVAWAAEARGEPSPEPFELERGAVDAVAPRHPVFLKRVDGAAFANAEALARARWGKTMPDFRGGRLGRDPKTGELTGMLYGRAAERMAELMPPASLERTLVGARAALQELARNGITSIHDVARIEAISQKQTFHTHVERSATDLEIFRELQRRDELSVRVYALLSLPTWEDVVAAGIRPGGAEGRIRFGALKGFIDAFLMEQPFADSPGWGGSFTFRFDSEAAMREDVLGADRAGFDVAVHVTGDKAHRLLIDWYEEAHRRGPQRDRRFRLIHAWHPSERDVARAGALGLLADVTPFHLIRSLGSLERHLGPERAARSHPWRSLADAGARLDLVSDWPGSYNERREVPLAPLANIAYAATRQDRRGRPAAGFHPEQRLSVEQGLRAYTSNPAWAAREENRLGRIAEGYAADLVVLSEDVLELAPRRAADVEVDVTILAGKVLYRRPGTEVSSR